MIYRVASQMVYGVRPEEVALFFEQYGFRALELLAVEGVVVDIQKALDELAESNPVAYRAAFEIIVRTARDPSILGMASHLLYVGRNHDN